LTDGCFVDRPGQRWPGPARQSTRPRLARRSAGSGLSAGDEQIRRGQRRTSPASTRPARQPPWTPSMASDTS